MKRFKRLGGLVLAALLVIPAAEVMTRGLSPAPPVVTTQGQAPVKVPAKAAGKAAAPAPTEITLDLAQAVGATLPASSPSLRAVTFKTADGKEGWVVNIPGGRPIATPAFAGGLLFVGGGYGSHEFYAFDAATGKLAWQIKTADDGPTAAVVEDGLVAFNTESCTLIVVDAKTGKVIWQEWLGDPLMSQPAAWKGRIYIAYPKGGRGQGPAPKPAGPEGPPVIHPGEGSHRLLSADLRTGRHIWEYPIPGDVISAPVIDDGIVYFTCFDGTSFALDAFDGRLIWRKQNAGTSAPVVSGRDVFYSKKEVRQGKAREGLMRADKTKGDEKIAQALAAGPAGYLEQGKGGGVALRAQQVATLDSSVGFSTPPAAAGLGAANRHLGVSSVAGGWAYQGSRPVLRDGQLLNAQGRYINSVAAASGATGWRAKVTGSGLDDDAQVFSPPALGREYMYLTSSAGHIVSVRQRDGRLGFAYAFNRPMAFQPALANGNVYVGTVDGLLICLKTGAADADGWYAWGGNAQHNK